MPIFGITLARLVADAPNDRDRWRWILFLVLLVLAVAVGWWLIAKGGIQLLRSDFSPAGITRPQ